MSLKEEIHARLANIDTQATITVDEIISAYGDDNKRKVTGYKQEFGRADILSECYGLKVTKNGNDYIFSTEIL